MGVEFSPSTKVLLVDDRAENLLTLEAVLASPRYQLVSVLSGQEALDALTDSDFAVIIMDVQMPGMDGFETAKRIKQQDHLKNIPIIFVTAINQEEMYVERGYRVGAVDYLFKPFDPYVLKSKVNVFIELFYQKKKLEEQAVLLQAAERRQREFLLAELELESLRRYGTLADAVPNIIWKVRPSCLAEYFNKTWSDYTGLNQEKSSGNGWKSAFHPDDLEELTKKIRDMSHLIGDRISLQLECRILNGKTQTYRYHLVRMVPERLRQSSDLLWIITCTDIHDRREAEKFLRRNEENSRFLAEGGSLLAKSSLDYQMTLRRIVQLTNQHFRGSCCVYQWLDTGELELSASGQYREDRSLNSIEPKFDWCLLGRSILQQLDEPQFDAFIIQDPQTLRASGLKSMMALPLSARSHSMGAIVIASNQSEFDDHDIRLATDLSRLFSFALDNALLYMRARDAIRARDEFLSIASHELKTPVTSLKLHYEISRRLLDLKDMADVSLPRLTKIMSASNRQLDRLTQLIEDLLDVTRIQSGKLELRCESVQLSDLTKEVVNRFEDQFNDARCQVELDAGNVAEGHWDRFRIEQVVVNLITNALKYAPGSLLSIKVYQIDDRAYLEIKDEGPGITPDKLPKIFERFERATLCEGISGLGLGLYISRQIVEGHSGHITVESELGKGSKFVISLPLKVSPEMRAIGA